MCVGCDVCVGLEVCVWADAVLVAEGVVDQLGVRARLMVDVDTNSKLDVVNITLGCICPDSESVRSFFNFTGST